MNRLANAEPLYRRALAIDEKIFGLEHPDVARDLNNLALLLYLSNRIEEAEPLYRRMLNILFQFASTTGHQHPHLQDAINDYSRLLMQMGFTRQQVLVRLHTMAPEFFR